MPLFHLDADGRLEPILQREWLLTNGIGGFASSTICGCNTRRYHGLLCAATAPPVGRMIALSRLGEVIVPEDHPERMLEFSVNEFAGERFHPRGDQYLRGFDLGHTADFHFDVEGWRITKQVLMVWQTNVAGVRYIIEPPPGKRGELRLLPMVAMRDFHALRRGRTDGFHVRGQGSCASVSRDGKTLWMRCDAMRFTPGEDWWMGHVYRVESERGQDDVEDLFQAGRFAVSIGEKTVVTLWAGMVDEKLDHDWDCEVQRIARAANESSDSASDMARRADPSITLRRLLHAANDFVVTRTNPDGQRGASIIAGYPWFADWGRDVMISLPGLLLTSGRWTQARQVLCLFANYVSEGMIPNLFDDYSNQPHYNTVDASLWFIHACYEYRRISGDEATFSQSLLPACRGIVQGYQRGTRYGIRMDPSDSLITQGDSQTQLTWMDAKCGGIAFTPRQGKCVEINALWHHALVLMGQADLAGRVAESFRKAFWLSPFRGLADVVHEGKRDTSIRPNQIFAASLEHSPLLPEQCSAVVEVVRRELLTPMGLRSLAASDPNYHGHYHGEQMRRDAAYHNGTVWAWPIGAFLEAYLRVNNRSAESRAQAIEWLTPLLDHMANDGCIGQIAEIFEADPPHRPVGAFAQAWSVAEVLRLAVELGL